MARRTGETSTGFLSGGGEMGERIRAADWKNSPLGASAHWPVALKTLVALMLQSRQPMFMAWGPALTWLYNDAFIPILGRKHPEALGQPALDSVWSEARDVLTPLFDRVFAGESVHMDDFAIELDRQGRLEEAHFSFSYNPVADENGKVVGLFGVCTETTAQITTQRRITEAQERQRRLFQQAPGFIIIMSGPEHVVEFVNDKHRALFGSDDWVGKPIRDAFPSLEGQGFFELLDKVYISGEPFEADGAPVRYQRSAHAPVETRYLSFVYAPSYDGDGSIAGIFCEGFDETEAYQAQAALRASEERLRSATEAAEIGTWDFNPATGELRWDDRCRALFGLSPDAEISYEGAFLKGLHPDDRQRAHAAVEAALSPDGSSAYDIEYRTIGREDGVERWCAATGNAIFENGEAVRFVGTIRDISERKRAEQRFDIVNRTGAQIASELQVDTIVQTITDAGVALTGAEFGAFFYNVLNDAGESYMLYALSGVPRENFSKFPMPRNTAVFAPTFNGEGVVRSDDITADPRYGHNAPRKGMPEGHLPVRSYLAVPVISRSGEVLGGLFFGHAETARFDADHETLLLGLAGQAATAIDNSRLYSALQRANETLEQRVAEEMSHRAEAEAALRQAQKMEAIGQLTGGIAHDFNNMLAVVIGALNMMQRRLDRGDRDIAKFVEAATDGANRASSLTKRLLAFSRQQALAPEAINANEMVAAMTDLLQRTLGEQIRIDVKLGADLGAVSADPSQLESSLLNLAVNARDAMPEGGTLTIETANVVLDDAVARQTEVAAGEYVMIAVGDTGSGMSAETLARAFEPFFTTKSVGQGTGLGLSQVFGFVRQSGGFVNIASELGAGACVKIYLPRVYGATPTLKAAELKRPAPSGSAGECILVVEDEERVRNFSEEALRDLGYSVLSAASGPAALAILDAHPNIAVLFTDVIMPDMTGKQLAELALAKRPDLKVVFTTGYARDVVVSGDVLRTSERQLLKPFSVDQLARTMRAVLDG